MSEQDSHLSVPKAKNHVYNYYVRLSPAYSLNYGALSSYNKLQLKKNKTEFFTGLRIHPKKGDNNIPNIF